MMLEDVAQAVGIIQHIGAESEECTCLVGLADGFAEP